MDDDKQLPATVVEREIIAAFTAGSPMQRLMGAALEGVGGVSFVQEWAEENPGEFMQMLLATNPPSHPGGSSGNTINLNMHPALAPGPLDQGRTFDHD